MRKLRCFIFAATLASAWSLARADDDAAAIRERLHSWQIAFNSRDAEGACDLYAPDLLYSVPGTRNGNRQAICDHFEKLFAKRDVTLSYAEPDIHETIVEGSFAIVRLTWTLTTEAEGSRTVTQEEGLDVFVLQDDRRWSISRFVAF